MRFAIREGGRTVGAGTIVDVGRNLRLEGWTEGATPVRSAPRSSVTGAPRSLSRSRGASPGPPPVSSLSAGSGPPGPPPPGERHISLWLDDEHAPPATIEVDAPHLLHARIGRAVAASIVTGGDTRVSDSDVPAGGLSTSWLVTSIDVEFDAAPGVSIGRTSNGGWVARFNVDVPNVGESQTVAVPMMARRLPDDGKAQLDVMIFVQQDLYRRLRAEVGVRNSGVPATLRSSTASIVTLDDVATPLRHAGQHSHHEWTTPPGTLNLIVTGGQVVVSGTAAVDGEPSQDVVDEARWFGGDALTRGRIDGVRKAAERFRNTATAYLDDIDPADLIARLSSFQPSYSWSALSFTEDAAHADAWRLVSTSVELRELAVRGNLLYNGFFPKGNGLRDRLDRLAMGHRLNIRWTRGTSDWVSDVPWGLMYLNDPPKAGQPVDPMSFAGLRFRIGYVTQTGTWSRVLGAIGDTHRGHLLYWDNDDIGRESDWQRQQYGSWTGQVFVPSPQATDRRTEVLTLLDSPSPGPMPVLYLFCTSAVGKGNDPVLCFANSSLATDALRTVDLPVSSLADQPFVFANACTTLSADAYYANELAQSFLDRGCRAFLGTETKVPIRMASRFAAVFFKFFYRSVDKDPIAAGEALAQTRLFLWTSYRNIGGLFYSLLNQYDVFVATDGEITRS
jgi:hypothetical protein